MCHIIEDLPISDCTYSRHKENKDTIPTTCCKRKLIILSLIATMNNNIYQQQRGMRAANKVAKTLINDAIN
jgi:hypothetical protein